MNEFKLNDEHISKINLSSKELINFLQSLDSKIINLNKSLNLSHAVSIMVYQLFQKNIISIEKIKTSNNDKISKFELSEFMNFLIKDLDSRGFFQPKEKKDSMIDNIYSIYNKIDLSKKELRMLWGMNKKLKKQPKL